MKTDFDDPRDELIATYLLGGLPPAERARLEEEFFADDELFERVTAEADEVIDAYVRGRLGAADRALFESNFLTDARRRWRLNFARDLHDALEHAGAFAPQAAPRGERVRGGRTTPLAFLCRPAFAFSLAAVAVALLALAAWVAFERGRRGAAQPEEARSVPAQTTPTPTPLRQPAQAEPANENLNAHSPTSNSVPAPPAEERASRLPTRGREGTPPTRRPNAAVATLLLSSASRDAGSPANRLTVPSDTEYVRLLINTGDRGWRRGYVAEVETVEGRGVWSGRASHSLGPQRGLVSATIPAAGLKTGGYILKLRGPGNEEAGEYYFAVVKPAP